MQKRILLLVLMLLTFSITLDAIAETKVGGPIAIDMTWTLDKSPYIVVQNIEVAEGATLTIEPGVTVKFEDFALIIKGTLIARGTEEKMITFTSNQDSSEPGDWKGIKFADSSGDAVFDDKGNYVSGSIFEYCIAEYARGVLCDSSSPFINYCTIKNNNENGIWVSLNNQDSIIIRNNTITGSIGGWTNGTWGYRQIGTGISILGGSAKIENNKIYKNSCSGIYVSRATATINANTISNNTASGVYSSNSSLTITNSTINNNSAVHSVKDYGGGIHADGGTLIVDKSLIKDNHADGNGGGIHVDSNSLTITASTVSGNSSENGGGIFIYDSSVVIVSNNITNNSSSKNGGGIYIRGKGEIKNNIISDDSAEYGGGIYALPYLHSWYGASGSLTITNNLISNNYVSEWGGGIYGDGAFGYEVTLFVNHNVIAGNPDGIYFDDVDAKSTINNNNIYNNERYGVINVTAFDIDAKNNWWGTIDPMEINQKIYDFFDNEKYGKVLYNPFLMSPDTDAPVISPIGTATAEGTAINLTWEVINLDDLAGYKIYYDTDSEEPPYEGTEATEGKSPIDVGKITGYKLSGLKPEMKYYIAITAYDTQGNEGWYGEVVTVETAEGELEPPLPPELSSPDDGVVIDTYTPTLKWVAYEYATSYGIQVAKDNIFSEILIDKSGITGVQYDIPSDNLKNLETYYWRVNAANSAGTSDWSEVRTFKVISGPSFTLSLSPALNFISLPMKPDIPYTARTFAEKLDATLVIRFDAPSQEFVPFVPEVSGTDGFVIEGGQGYIVNVLEEKQVTFTGSLWTNTPPASPKQTPDKENAIWAFAVAGLISTEPDQKEPLSELRVTVKNQRTGQFSQCALTDDMEEFATAFVDMSRNSVVRTGDMLEITVRNSRGQLVSVPVVQEVSEIDLAKATVVANLRLGGIIPSQSQLFQNYPNPFNPETWIPYQLAESAEVTIRIYNVAGQLVQVLNLGQKTAGRYLDKTRAVYWDGMNEHNEKISSGVYFYSIEAGNFRATKKLLIAK